MSSSVCQKMKIDWYEPITMTNVILTVLILARGITPRDRALRILDSIWCSSTNFPLEKKTEKEFSISYH